VIGFGEMTEREENGGERGGTSETEEVGLIFQRIKSTEKRGRRRRGTRGNLENLRASMVSELKLYFAQSFCCQALPFLSTYLPPCAVNKVGGVFCVLQFQIFYRFLIYCSCSPHGHGCFPKCLGLGFRSFGCSMLFPLKISVLGFGPLDTAAAG
jgi:hypothetical protein